ncbi:hypothetical protein D0863_07392 [Hortaea werneckii]|uniref:DUF7730 domain-containing protein n=1 Tax=Hortaea werneckii TaxID=91943 RepID=A0A3M7DUK9_HORWE|nr:hypothetical protein D0863_07392 [Hortaea werneckii]
MKRNWSEALVEPDGLLHSANVPVSRKKVYQKNKKRCLLFSKLPSEIRDVIWQYVFGGLTIHISDDALDRNACVAKVCRLHVDPEREAVALREGEQNPYHVRHFRCFEPQDPQSNNPCDQPQALVSVLRVCRQIHDEAALIPFIANFFSFARFTSLSRFLDRLVPAQAHAIERLAWLEHSNWSSHWNHAAGVALRRRLPSLSQGVVFVEFRQASIELFLRNGHTRGVRAADLSDFLRGLAGGCLAKANVAPLYHSSSLKNRDQFKGRVWQWAINEELYMMRGAGDDTQRELGC